MNTVRSSDGTTIAYERSGDGPPLILVDGALCSRAMGPSRPLAKQLAEHFTVYVYDRRGRNESGDTAPYDVAREVEDLEALIDEAGGEASVYGISSGAVLALAAARRSRSSRSTRRRSSSTTAGLRSRRTSFRRSRRTSPPAVAARPSRHSCVRSASRGSGSPSCE
jgi:pimeloyl-ACP methyl ester carboxylesterase